MKRVFLAAFLLAISTTAGAQQGTASPFPHDRHERLFPLCESCHAGIATGDQASSMPDEKSCVTCHNGTDAKVVSWRRPERVQGLLRFSHPSHGREVDSTGRACATCHGVAGRPRMTVQRAAPPSCLGCHTHRATDHLRIMQLVELAADFAINVLAPGGVFIAKVFQGGTEHELLHTLKRHFTTTLHAKPPASRQGSAESYLIAKGFKG